MFVVMFALSQSWKVSLEQSVSAVFLFNEGFLVFSQIVSIYVIKACVYISPHFT